MRTPSWIVFLLLGVTACADSAPEPELVEVPIAGAITERPPVGVNLGELHYHSADVVFTDVFRQAGPWIPQRVHGGKWNTGEALDVDDNGWIRSLKAGQAAGTLIFRVDGHYPAGRYICLYDGEGRIEFSFDARAKKTESNRIELDVTPSKRGIYLKLTKTNPDNPLRNIRIMLPGYETSGETFNPEFVSRLDGFEFIRFMNWNRTNDSMQKTWADRATPSTHSQATDRGVAYEFMAELANETDTDAWITIPHLVDNAYARELAVLFARELEPERNVYIEFSNEVWNGQFDQADHARREGRKAKLAKRALEAQLAWYARRSTEVMDVFRAEFGDNARVTRVLSTQAARPETSKLVLEYAGPADALAIAPYIGIKLGKPDTANEVAGYTLERVFEILREDTRLMMGRAKAHRDIATGNGLDFLAYEAGQHLAGYRGAENNDTLTDLFQAANRAPEMEAIYTDYLNTWADIGGGAIGLYMLTGKYSKWGSWGLAEYMDMPVDESPKLRAVYNFIDHPKVD